MKRCAPVSCLVGIAFACTLAPMLVAETTNTVAPAAIPDLAAAVTAGRQLFLANCAHCHAADATGDEGPDLHGLTKSDARLAKLIREGIPGEMPRFGSKFQESEITLLIQYLRSLPPS